jgi:hypothetical protein
MSIFKFSNFSHFIFFSISEADSVVAEANVCTVGVSPTIVGLASRAGVILPSSAFLPAMAASLRVTPYPAFA